VTRSASSSSSPPWSPSPFLAGIVWAGAALASWLSGHGGVDGGIGPALEAALRLSRHLGDPKQAWAEPARSHLPGPFLYWVATGLALTAGVALAYGGWRLFRTPEPARRPPPAPRR
jgi:hypothetical protein